MAFRPPWALSLTDLAFSIFFLAIRGVVAHFEGLCAEIGPFRNVGVNLGIFRTFLEALVALIVFLMSYSA